MIYDVVIVAGGIGKRAGLGYNKLLFVMKNQKSVLENTCQLFFEDEDCKKVIVVCNDEIKFTNDKLIVTRGGKERKDSVYNGLKLVTSEYVFVHDGARPYLRKEALDQLKEEVVHKKAIILAHKAIDTVKYVKDGKIEKTIDRNNIYLAETPQAFLSSLLKECYEKCDDTIFTDEASLLESLGKQVYILEDEYDNKKMTLKEDFQ